MFNKNKLQQNNKGFSLIELLVAVAILAVIVTPFLMAFLTTTRINASTKNQQRAKFAATNVMEDIRSRSVEDVLADEKTKKQDDGTYLYTTTQNSDGVDYTVEAVLDPNYSEAKDDDEATDYNAKVMAEIYGMNSAYDAFYELDATTDYSKIEQLAELELSSRNRHKVKQIYDSVNRDITLTIKANESGGVDVTVKSTYTKPNSATINTVATQEQIIYTSNDADNLRNIYLFYNPLYNGTANQARETITIVNEDDIKCEVYLCKQEWPQEEDDKEAYDAFPFLEKKEGTTDPEETTKKALCNYLTNADQNKNYLVNVRLKEKRPDTSLIVNGEPDVLTTIRTNIDSNIINKYIEETNSDKVGGHLKLLYSYSGDNYGFSVQNGGATYSAAQMMGLANLTKSEVTDHVFHVTVMAYEGIGEDRKSEVKCTLKSTTQ